MMKRLKRELAYDEYTKLKDMIWISRKQHECLTQVDEDKPALLYKHSPIMKKAHSQALKLTHIFNAHNTGYTDRLAQASENATAILTEAYQQHFEQFDGEGQISYRLRPLLTKF